MKLGISLPVFSADVSRPLAMADRSAVLGVDGVFTPDHLFPPVFYPPSGPDRPALEPFTLLSAVAARHPSMAVGTLVTRVTLRPAGLLAKQAAALDAMTGGRAILAVGSGDRASLPEHETYGIAFPPVADRLRLLEESITAMRALFEGRAWPGGELVPPMDRPLAPAGAPELWVGGLSEAVIAIAARTADAWNGWGQDPATFAASAARLRELADGREVAPTWGGIALVGEDRTDLDRLLAERDRRGLPRDGLWAGTADELRAFAERLAGAGATWCILLPVGPPDRLDLIARTLRP